MGSGCTDLRGAHRQTKRRGGTEAARPSSIYIKLGSAGSSSVRDTLRHVRTKQTRSSSRVKASGTKGLDLHTTKALGPSGGLFQKVCGKNSKASRGESRHSSIARVEPMGC